MEGSSVPLVPVAVVVAPVARVVALVALVVEGASVPLVPVEAGSLVAHVARVVEGTSVPRVPVAVVLVALSPAAVPVGLVAVTWVVVEGTSALLPVAGCGCVGRQALLLVLVFPKFGLRLLVFVSRWCGCR